MAPLELHFLPVPWGGGSASVLLLPLRSLPFLLAQTFASCVAP